MMKYKKIFLFTGLLCSSYSLLAQKEDFTITGKLPNVKNGAKIYLISYGQAKAKRDSAFVQNGSYTFKGIISTPCAAQLYMPADPKTTRLLLPIYGKLDFRNLYLDKGTTVLTGTDSIKTSLITGSKINEEDEQLTKLLSVVERKIESLQNDYRSAPEELKKSGLYGRASQIEFDNAANSRNDVKMAFAVNNPDSYVSLNAVFEAARSRAADYYRVNSIYKLLTDKYKNTKLAKEAEELIAIGLNTSIGATAVNFTQPDLNGKPHQLSDFKGKYVLLEMWASWCGPCRKESPNLVEAYKKYSDKNFTILAVSVDKDKAEWLKAIEKDGMPYLQLNDLKGPGINDVAAIYGTQGIPENFLINPEGKIIAKNLRGEDLRIMLKNILE